MKKVLFLSFLLLPLWALSQDVFVNTTPGRKNVLFEEYTGASCGNCPRAHAKEAAFLAAYPDRFFAVNIHAGGFANPYHEGDPWLNTDEGEDLNKAFNITGYPSAVLMRHKFGRYYDADEDLWGSYIEDSILPQDAAVNIAAQSRIDWATRVLTVKVQLYYTSMPAQSEQYLHIALTQDRILAGQSNYGDNTDRFLADGNYIHMHVFRGSINEGGMNGDAVSVQTGTVIEKTIEYTLPETIKDIPVTLPELNVVAFVTADPLYEVENACASKPELVNMPEDFQIMWFCHTAGEPVLGCDPAAVFEFKVENTLGEDVETLTYSVSTGAGEKTFTQTFSPALKVGETATVKGEEIALGVSNEREEIVIKVTGVNNKPYTYEHNSTAVIPVTHPVISVPTDLVILNVVQDKKGEEITWLVGEVGGDVLYSGGPYENLPEKGIKDNHSELRFSRGCYYFSVRDAGGDGIRSGKYGSGFIVMNTWDGEQIFFDKGKYGEGFDIALDARTAGIEHPVRQPVAFKLYPNPASREAFIEDVEPGNYTVSVYALSGVMVRAPQTITGGGRTAVSLNGLPHGLYIVELRGENRVAYQKLIVK